MISYRRQSCYVFAHFDQPDPEEEGKRPRQPHRQHPRLCVLIGQVSLDLLKGFLVDGMVIRIVGGEYGLAGDVLQVAEPRSIGHVPAADGVLADDVGIGAAVFVDDLPVLLLRDIHDKLLSDSSQIKVELQSETQAVAAPEVGYMHAQDVVAVLLDAVLDGERDVPVDVHLGLEGGVGLRGRGVLPDHSGVDQLEGEQGSAQLQAERRGLVVAVDVVDADVFEEGAQVCPVELGAALGANVPVVGRVVGPSQLERGVLPSVLEDVEGIDKAV